VVGDEPAMVTGCGGETPVRNALGTTAYQALPVSKRGREVTVEAQWRSCGGVRVARRELVPSMATAEPLCCCWECCGASDERRMNESEWEGRGARLLQWTAAAVPGRPQRVARAVRRPATRGATWPTSSEPAVHCGSLNFSFQLPNEPTDNAILIVINS